MERELTDRNSVELVCANCDTSFRKYRGAYNAFVKRNQGGRFYCCRSCADEGKKKFNDRTKDSRVEVLCVECGKSKKIYPSQSGRSENYFCSVECKHKYEVGEKAAGWKGGWTANCDQCGEEYSEWRNGQEHHERHFCSVECRSKYFVGDKCQAWRGGIAPMSAVLRGIKEYQEWMQLILSRDGYKCVECGAEEHLHVHHLESFGKLISRLKISSVKDARECEELWDIDNGQALCVHCHAEKHPRYKKLMLKKVA